MAYQIGSPARWLSNAAGSAPPAVRQLARKASTRPAIAAGVAEPEETVTHSPSTLDRTRCSRVSPQESRERPVICRVGSILPAPHSRKKYNKDPNPELSNGLSNGHLIALDSDAVLNAALARCAGTISYLPRWRG